MSTDACIKIEEAARCWSEPWLILGRHDQVRLCSRPCVLASSKRAWRTGFKPKGRCAEFALVGQLFGTQSMNTCSFFGRRILSFDNQHAEKIANNLEDAWYPTYPYCLLVV